LLRGSRACRQLVMRKLATFRPSRHVKMVWHVANFLVTSRPCRTCGIWRTTRQADKPAADCRSTNHVSAWKLRHCLRKRMAAPGTCLQVLTVSNLIDAIHNEPILWNCYLEATEEEKELTWATIADICGLNQHVVAIIMSLPSSSIFNSKRMYIFL